MISLRIISKRTKSASVWTSASFWWLIYQIFLRCSSNLREKVIFFSLSIYYWIYWRFRFEKNMALIRPDLTKKQVKKNSKRLKNNMVMNFTDMFNSKPEDAEKEIGKLEVIGDIEKILDHYRAGRKIVATAVHTGRYNKEFNIFILYLIQKLAPHRLRALIPYERIPLIDTVMAGYRQSSDSDMRLEPAEKGKTLEKAREYLNEKKEGKEGKIVLIPIDILRKNKRGVLCKIGAAMVMVPAGAVVLAYREDAVLVPIFPLSGEDGKMRVEVGLPFELEKTGDEKKDIEDNVRRLFEGICVPFIQKHCDEWLQLPWSDLKPVKTQVLKRG